MWEPSPTFPQNRQERPPHALFQNTAGMESKPPKNKGPAQTPEEEALAEGLSRHGWLRTWQTSSSVFPSLSATGTFPAETSVSSLAE